MVRQSYIDTYSSKLIQYGWTRHFQKYSSKWNKTKDQEMSDNKDITVFILISLFLCYHL